MFPVKMTLPEFQMTGGESKSIVIPIYNKDGKQIDVSGMTARLAITDYVNVNMSPYALVDCEVKPGNDDNPAVLFVALDPSLTIDLCGKYIYQVTGKDFADAFGVMQGVLMIAANRDRDAISL